MPQTMNWKVRIGYSFTAGAGGGAGLFVFDFLNMDENHLYGMAFAGLGLAGGPGGGKWGGIKELTKKLIVTAGLKTAGTVAGFVSDTTPGFKDQPWSTLLCNKAFSATDLDDSTGRVTILGAAAMKHGYYACYVSASDGIISFTPLFESVSVMIKPSGMVDLQVGVILGLWWSAYDYPIFA